MKKILFFIIIAMKLTSTLQAMDEIEFNGMNKASGIYYYKISTDKFQETKKMILVK